MERVNNDDVYETCDDIDAYLDEEMEPEDKKKLTSKQLQAIRYRKQLRKVFDNSLKFLQTPISKVRLLNSDSCDYESTKELLDRVVELTAQQKVIKAELDKLRPLLKELILKVIHNGETKVFYKGYVVAVSQNKGGGRSTKKFDESKFKAENPDLYEKYCYTTYSGGAGGNLSLRDITDTQATELRKLNKVAKEKLTWEK